MQTLITLWWVLFCTAVGLCLGSFLNAVIYRLPRDRSLRQPLWSFCPACTHRIAWYDNLPILSFIALRGRCRHCGGAIAGRYPVIEATMALIVLLLLDAFFIGQVRSGLSQSRFGLTDRLADDWPILLAHVLLFACLLPMAVIDLEHYWVDVRFTNAAAIMGFLCHALWTPKHSAEWIRPSDAAAVMSLLVLLALGLARVILVVRYRVHQASWAAPESEPAPALGPACTPSHGPPPSPVSASRAAGWVAALLLLGMLAALMLGEAMGIELPHAWRALPPLLLFFGLIVRESAVKRVSDQQVAEAIHEERHDARRMVLSELGWLSPAILAAGLGVWLMAGSSEWPGRLSRLLHAGGGRWSPLYGLATAASGYVIAGALGWSVRIVFTLGFGKEAFGTGDIHLMAAAGCVAGWPVVVLGFFLTCGLAMIGWVVLLPIKRTRALPLGPWLSLSFLAVVVFYDSILRWPVIQRVIAAARVLLVGNSPLP